MIPNPRIAGLLPPSNYIKDRNKLPVTQEEQRLWNKHNTDHPKGTARTASPPGSEIGHLFQCRKPYKPRPKRTRLPATATVQLQRLNGGKTVLVYGVGGLIMALYWVSWSESNAPARRVKTIVAEMGLQVLYSTSRWGRGWDPRRGRRVPVPMPFFTRTKFCRSASCLSIFPETLTREERGTERWF